jgi:hypothetical protein
MGEGRQEFERQLRDLGISPDPELSDSRLSFDYDISSGRFKGQRIKVGVEVPPNFPMTPPGGPHVMPRILPINEGAPNHPDRVAQSPFGDAWEYWSRPFIGWKGTEGVGRYLAFLDYLFDTIPPAG